MSDRIVVMNEGAIEQVGSPSEIYNAPRTRFVASFVGTLNLLDGRIVDASSGAIDIDGQRATTARKLNGAKPGDILPMALRPEALRIGEGGDDRNTLAGVIEDVAFLGAVVRVRVRLAEAAVIIDTFNTGAADLPARGFMFALGCIQSLSCHTDHCPTGVATQDKTRSRALVVEDKTERVRNYHRSMLNALAELTAAAGLEDAHDFRPIHFSRRVGASETKTFAELYPQLQAGELIAGARESWWREQWQTARSDRFTVAV